MQKRPDVTPPIKDLDLGATLSFLSSIWRLNHCLERASKHMESRIGVTGQQRMVIRVIGRYPRITPGQVARALWIDAGTLSAALKRLEARKLVRRERDANDRRRVMLQLTEAGAVYDVPTAATVEAAVEAALANEPVEASAEARRFIEALAKRINEVAEFPVDQALEP